MSYITFLSTDLFSELHGNAAENGSFFIPEGELLERIKEREGFEFYYSIYSFPLDKLPMNHEKNAPTVKGYRGEHKLTLGLIPFDFDSKDNPAAALKDAEAFISDMGLTGHASIYSSGSKGYHVYVPGDVVGELLKDSAPSRALAAMALKLKEVYPALDSSVYDSQRKFRIPGGKHQKTGNLKTLVSGPSIEELVYSPYKITPVFSVPLSTLYAEMVMALSSAVTPEWQDSDEESPLRAEMKALKDKPCLVKMLDRTYAPGERHDAMLVIASDLFHQGLKPSEVNAKMRPWVLKNGSTERQKELDRFLKDLAGGAPQYYGCNWPSRKKECSAACALLTKLPASMLLGRDMPQDATPAQAATIAKKTELLRVKRYATKFIESAQLVYHLEMEKFLQFNGTHHIPIHDGVLLMQFERDMTEIASNKNKSEFLSTLKHRIGIPGEVFFKARDTHINFLNGHYNKATGLIESRDSARLFRYCLPVNYDPAATAPTFQQFLQDVIWDDTTQSHDPESAKLLLEFMGYTLSGDEQFAEKMLLLGGGGANGKGTVFSIMRALLGEGNYCALSVGELADAKERIKIETSYANFETESKWDDFKESALLRKLSSKYDPITVRPMYKPPYEIVSRCKLWFSYNRMPSSLEQSEGFFRRFCVIPFNRTAADSIEEAMAKKDLRYQGVTEADFLVKDTSIGERLHEELAGVFNMAWSAYLPIRSSRLSAVKVGFTKSKAGEAVLAEERELGNPIKAILGKCLEPRVGAYTPMDDICQMVWQQAESEGGRKEFMKKSAIFTEVRGIGIKIGEHGKGNKRHAYNCVIKSGAVFMRGDMGYSAGI